MYQFLAAKAATEIDAQNDHSFRRLFSIQQLQKGMVISLSSVIAVCISEKKGTVKKTVPEVYVKTNHGIVGDVHAGDEVRQVSLLAVESVDKLRDKMPDIEPGAFAENILTTGICLYTLPPGAKLHVGDALFEVTQIGKECHNKGCVIERQTGNCVMPSEGIFARVLEGGAIRPGDKIIVEGNVH